MSLLLEDMTRWSMEGDSGSLVKSRERRRMARIDEGSSLHDEWAHLDIMR